MDRKEELIQQLKEMVIKGKELVSQQEDIIEKLIHGEKNVILDQLRVVHKKIIDDDQLSRNEKKIFVQNQLKNIRDKWGIGKKKY